MRLILGFVTGLTGAALFLSGVDHQTVTRELKTWVESPDPPEATPVEVASARPILKHPAPAGPEAETESDVAVPGPMADIGSAAKQTAPDEGAAQNPAIDSVSVTQPQWQPVWRPFKVRSAATGFATRLAELTGGTYRVRRLADQVYQVELAYRSEDERRALTERVRSLTGLELGADGP